MSSRSVGQSRAYRSLTAALIAVVVVSLASVTWAGHRFFRNDSVGGVSIDTEGVVREFNVKARQMLLEELRKEVDQPQADLMAPTQLRKISLRKLEEAVEDALRNNLGQLPEEIRYLAGIQRIQYVLVYPEQNDIVLAGPGEGWRVDENANVVGITTGRPVLELDDLIVALRSVRAAREVGITCSIEPTEAGRRALNQLLEQVGSVGRNPNLTALEQRMKEAFGPQQVLLSGIPETSHFARVMVAADYRMKRLAMNLDEAPVRGLPSYVEMLQGSRVAEGVNPRWWLACNYEPLARSEDGLAWELRGPGVRVMTEDDLVNAAGEVKQTGKSSPLAQKWADLMTDKYDELSGRDPVFGQLRNLMDLCVVAALIEHERLLDQAGLSLPMLTDSASDLTIGAWNAPKSVAPQCSFLKTRNGWIVTASGGVDIDSWSIASRSEVQPEVAHIRSKAQPANSSWWWN